MSSGASQTKRYFTPSAGPFDWSGHTSTLRNCRRFSSKRTTMPPTMPEPDALDQMMFESVGSGVAQPLSPPPTACHIARGMMPLAEAAVARAAVGRLVLLVAEHVVGDLVVDGHVVHLRVGQPLPEPRAPAVDRDRQALVVRDDHAVGVGRIDPDVVVVAAGRLVARRPA